jgi:hypothetical protein
MRKPRNNFPREGMHSPVTWERIDALAQERAVPNTTLEYTIGGGVETQVHSTINAEREAAITSGTRAMKRASQNIRAGFEASKPNLRAKYILAQKAKPASPKPVRKRAISPKRSP